MGCGKYLLNDWYFMRSRLVLSFFYLICIQSAPHKIICHKRNFHTITIRIVINNSPRHITVYTENWVYRHEFSFTRLIVEDMLFHWNLLQGWVHPQSHRLESPKAQCSTFQSWDWWCTKGKVKVNRFFLEARWKLFYVNLYVSFLHPWRRWDSSGHSMWIRGGYKVNESVVSSARL